MTGWSADTLLGKKFGEIDTIFGIVPEDRKIILDSARLAMQKPGETFPVPPFRLSDVHGEMHFIEGTHTFLPAVRGLEGLLFHGRDVTGRIRAEQELKRKNEELGASYEQLTASEEELRSQYEELAWSGKQLRESEEKFRGIFEQTHDALVLFTEDDGAIDCNRQALELFGYPSKEELLRLTPADTSPPFQADGQDSRVAAEERIRNVREKGVEHFEWLQQRKDGSTFLADILLSAFELDGKRVFLSSIRDITVRKKLEDDLQLLRISVERSYDEVFWMNFDGSIRYVNDAACRITGYSREELLSMKISELDPGCTPEIWTRCITDLRERKNQFIISRHRCRNGTIIDVEIVAVYVGRGGQEYSFAFVRDITERKRAEMALAESEERYRSLVNTSFDGIAIHQGGILVYLNQTGARILGYDDPAALIGRPALEVVHPDDRARVGDRIRQSPDKPMDLVHERFLQADGSTIDADVATTPCTWQGNPASYVTFRDISIQKRAERELLESERKYRHIIENLQDAYIRTNRDGHITMVNPAAVRMYGYNSVHEMIGLPAEYLYANPVQREKLLQRLREGGGGVTDVTGTGHKKDGTHFWASLSIQFIRDADGSVEGTEATVRDISERKAMEQAIQEANRKLNLLSSITRHDVANQLSVIQGYSQLAMMKNPDPVVADFLAKIQTAADTITRQIEFTKAYQELGVRTPAWFRLDEVIAAAGGPEITTSATCAKTDIFSDPMIERVFFNLFDNARRHGGAGTEIAIRCERAPDGLVIIIEDNGVGIPPGEKEKIFEKGYGKNSGFGLFLAREILAITGITIRETGYQGIGARFEVTVPKEMWRPAPPAEIP